eukprot:scaffold1860_cov403-Prasinococcus_capsulatus_cf.AAC.3
MSARFPTSPLAAPCRCRSKSKCECCALADKTAAGHFMPVVSSNMTAPELCSTLGVVFLPERA